MTPTDPTDRRKALRREEDVEQREISEGAVEIAPIVTRLLRTGKVASAVAVLCTFGGGAAAALGFRMMGPKQDIAEVSTKLTTRIDANAAAISATQHRFDSLLVVIGEMKADLSTATFVLCVQSRRNYPDLRQPGCDAAERRSAKP